MKDCDDFSLIDVSASDDDFLLASSSGNPGDFLAEGSLTNQPSHYVELQPPRKNGKCNLRKSLAWDSAFFTNAGVLDAEELSSILEGGETSVKQKPFLPGIEEDVSKSFDSISTFESDNLTLESLEADLFCDVRASIQRTSRPSAQGNWIGTKLMGDAEPRNGCSTKAVEITPGNAVKPKLATKKLNPSVQPPSRILKPGTVSKQIAKPPVRSKESKPLLPRPPEAAAKLSSIGAAATKKTSIGASRAKLESNSSGMSKGKVASFSKISYQVDSNKTVPKALATSKLLSGSSVLSRGAATRSLRSSCDSSSSTSSGTIRKSPTDINKRKTDKNVIMAPGSKIRAPSRVAVKSKSRSGDSHLSDYLKSTSQLSSSISPTSSISEWSTESSSSTATINQKPIGLKPCSTSFQDTVLESNVPHSQKNSSDRVSNRRESQYTGLLNQSKKQSSSESLAHPASAKPSGLRMPSATIGFFDGVKAAAKTPCGGSRSRSALPSSLPRSGALNNTPSGISGRPKEVGKPDSRRTVSNLKPVCLKDHSAGLPKILNAKNDRVSDMTSKISEIDLLDPAFEASGEILNGGKDAADSSSEAIEDISLVSAKKDESPVAKLPSSINQATIAVEDVGKAMRDCIEDCSVSPFSKKGRNNRKEHSDVEKVDTVSETSSKVLILDPALEEKELLNEGKQAVDSSSEARRDIIVVTKKEVSPDVKLRSLTNHSHATMAAGDVGNSMNISDCIEDLTESPFSNGGQGNRKEHSDIENVDTVSETSSKVSEIALLDPAFEEEFEVVHGGKHAVACSLEAKKDSNLVVVTKEASPEVKLMVSTNHAAIAVQDVPNAMHVTECIEDPTSLESGSNKKEHSDVESIDTISEISPKASETVLLDLAFEEIWELLNEGRNAADSCSEVTKDIYMVAANKEASPEVKSHSSTDMATLAIVDVCDAMHITDYIKDFRKENSDIENVDTVSETSFKVSESALLDPALEEKFEVNGGEPVAGCSLEAMKDINLVVAKKEASPEVKLQSSTTHAAFAVQDMSNAIHVTDCIEGPTGSPFSLEGGSNKEHSDVESVDTIPETSSNVSEGVLLDLAFEEIWELLKEGRNAADSFSEATEDMYLNAAKKEASPEVKLQSSTNHAAIDVQYVPNAMLVTDCIEDPTGSLLSLEGESSKMEHISETDSNVSESVLLDFAFNEILEFLNEEATEDMYLTAAKKEASPEVKSQSSTNHAAINVQYVSNAMLVTDCIEDPTGSLFSPEGGSSKKEHICETSSNVSESVLLDFAFKEILELLNEEKIAADSCSEDTEDMYLTVAKKESPEVKSQSSTNHAAIDVQDVSNAMHVTDCIEDPTGSLFPLESGSSQKEDSDVERVDTISETSSKVSESVLLDLAFKEILELLNEERNAADSCSEATEDMYLVAAKKEASAEMKSQSSANHAAIDVQDVFNAMHVTDNTKDLTASPSSKDARHDRNQNSDVDSVCTSQDVSETEENSHAEKQVDSFSTHLETKNNEMEMPSESNLLVNEDKSSLILSCLKDLCTEESVQSESTIPGSQSLLSSEVSSGTRTPFANKNFVADLIKAYNRSAQPPVQASVKSDTLPSSTEGQKENC